MAEASPTRPQPTREHLGLRELAGQWRVECTYYMDPTGAETTAEALETVEMLGDFWAVSRFEADIGGLPFEGRATLGYEPASGRWVSTWIDVMSPHLYHFTGGYDEARRVRTMSGEGPDPRTGAPTRFRTVEEAVDPGTRRFEMFLGLPDGGEHRMFRYVYRRKRKKK